MRSQDVLVANELHPEERAALQTALGRDRRVKVMGIDGWSALKALLPPKERRGVVLIDPPFEEEGELGRLADGLAEGLQRFATGTFIAWYPIKDLKPIARFREGLETPPGRKLLSVELMTRRPNDPDRLNGCGLIIANPPYTLQGELDAILPELTRRMAQDGGGTVQRPATRNPHAGTAKIVLGRKTAYAQRTIDGQRQFALRQLFQSPILRRSSGGPSTRRRLLRLS